MIPPKRRSPVVEVMAIEPVFEAEAARARWSNPSRSAANHSPRNQAQRRPD
jgi:hypothetical protein